MRNIVRSSFLWPFVFGFLIGTIGLVSIEPSGTARTLERHFIPGIDTAR